MHTGLPYREPAGGWTRQQFLGGCFQHWRSSEANTPRYNNLTRVANWLCADEGGGGVIVPYTRDDGVDTEGALNPNCTTQLYGDPPVQIFPGHPNYCDAGHPVHKKPCNRWNDFEFPSGFPWQLIKDRNVYELMPDKVVNLAKCQKVGFKAVQARKVWHGELAFQDLNRDACDTTRPPPNDVITADPATTRYLTKRFFIRLRSEFWEEGRFIHDSAYHNIRYINRTRVDVDQTFTVNPTTGRMSLGAGCVNNSVTEMWMRVDGGPEEDSGGLGPSSGCGGHPSFVGGIWESVFASLFTNCRGTIGSSYDGSPYGPNPITEDTPAGLQAQFAVLFPNIHWVDGDTHCDETLTKNRVEVSNTSILIELEQVGNWGDPPEEDGKVHARGFTASADVLYSQSTPYTATTVEAQCKALLGAWDLANDRVYPWRTDRYTSVNPMVTYDEVPQPIVFPNGPITCADFDAQYAAPYAHYTGQILGAPITEGQPVMALPDQTYNDFVSAGSPGTVHYLTYKDITAVTGVARYNCCGELKYTASGGDYTVDLAAGTVTQLSANLTDTQEVCTADPTDLICYPPSRRDYLRISYTVTPLAGGHFDRRHITPKYWFNTGTSQWVVDFQRFGAYSGGTRGLDITDEGQPWAATQWTGATNDEIASRGRFFPHGAWVKWEDTTSNCWMQKYAEIKLPWRSQSYFGPCGSDRDLMTGQTCAPVDVGGTMTCKLQGGTNKWPSAWPIEGDRGCTFIDEGASVIKVTTDAPVLWLRVGDVVDFTNEAGVVTESNKTVTVIDGAGDGNGPGTYFKFSGSIPTGTRVKSHDAPGFWWYDTDGKGEYLIVQHVLSPRTTARLGANATQVGNNMDQDVIAYSVDTDSLPFNRCTPAVMCFSPNYDAEDPDSIDSFDNGKTYGFSYPTPDDRYGSWWVGVFKQTQTDLWYELPLEPCGNYDEDEEDCNANACDWVQDDGAGYGNDDICDKDLGGTQHYPHAPLTEARKNVPTAWNGDTAPSLPDAYYPTLTEIQTVHWDHGIILDWGGNLGPYATSTENDVPNMVSEEFAPWNVFQRMQYNICNVDGDGNPIGKWTEDGSLDGSGKDSGKYWYRGYENVLGTWMCGAEPPVEDIDEAPPDEEPPESPDTAPAQIDQDASRIDS